MDSSSDIGPAFQRSSWRRFESARVQWSTESGRAEMNEFHTAFLSLRGRLSVLEGLWTSQRGSQRRLEEKVNQVVAESNAMHAETRGLVGDRGEELSAALTAKDASLRSSIAQLTNSFWSYQEEQRRTLSNAVEHLEVRLADEVAALQKKQDTQQEKTSRLLASATESLESRQREEMSALSACLDAKLDCHVQTSWSAFDELDKKLVEETLDAAREAERWQQEQGKALALMVEAAEGKIAGWIAEATSDWRSSWEHESASFNRDLTALDQKVESLSIQCDANADNRLQQQETLQSLFGGLDRRLNSKVTECLTECGLSPVAREDSTQKALKEKVEAEKLKSAVLGLHERLRGELARENSKKALVLATQKMTPRPQKASSGFSVAARGG